MWTRRGSVGDEGTAKSARGSRSQEGQSQKGPMRQRFGSYGFTQQVSMRRPLTHKISPTPPFFFWWGMQGPTSRYVLLGCSQGSQKLPQRQLSGPCRVIRVRQLGPRIELGLVGGLPTRGTLLAIPRSVPVGVPIPNSLTDHSCQLPRRRRLGLGILVVRREWRGGPRRVLARGKVSECRPLWSTRRRQGLPPAQGVPRLATGDVAPLPPDLVDIVHVVGGLRLLALDELVEVAAEGGGREGYTAPLAHLVLRRRVLWAWGARIRLCRCGLRHPGCGKRVCRAVRVVGGRDCGFVAVVSRVRGREARGGG